MTDKDRRSLGKNFTVDVEAMQDIMWCSTENDWFRYYMGSRLNFFQLPLKYRMIARDEVHIFFVGPKASSKHEQSSNMKSEEKQILWDKLLNIIKK